MRMRRVDQLVPARDLFTSAPSRLGAGEGVRGGGGVGRRKGH